MVTQANLPSLDATDLTEEEEFAAIANSDEGWVDEREAMSEVDRAELDATVTPVRLVLIKLRKFAFTVIHSSTKLLPEWEELVATLDLADRIMPRDVTTRWNSTYDMLVFAYEYRKAIDTLTSHRSLRAYELSDDDWEIVEQLIGVLRKTLNRYYDMTDHSEVYRIAMVLHPRHKLEYFVKAKWEKEWIKTAEKIVRDEFNRSYADREIAEGDDGYGIRKDSAMVRLYLSPPVYILI
ncbi:hypothetical protein BJ912DRAFT_865291 [Pholiota molesta]|nr:hypothetical protein BJ912DRAFT_865291 [Pholiota molesta]